MNLIENTAYRKNMKPCPRVTFAISTPFTPDNTVDHPGIERTLAWLKEQGVESVIPAGTTGEFPGITMSERCSVLVTTRKSLGPAAFVFSNISACAIDDVLEHAVRASASGAAPDALLCLPPYYHAPFATAAAATGVETFFRAVLNRLPRDSPPLFIYNFAVHTQQPVSPDVWRGQVERGDAMGPTAVSRCVACMARAHLFD